MTSALTNCFTKLAVRREHLQTPVLTVRHIHEPVVGDADRVHHVVIRNCFSIRKTFRCGHRAAVDAAGWLAERAPHTLELASVRIEHDDAMVAVAVGDENLVGARVDPRIGGAMHVDRVGVAFALIAAPDLQQKFAVEREFEQCIVGHRLKPRIPALRAIVAAYPHMTVAVDVDTVLALRPFEAAARSAPRFHVVARRIEYHHGRRRQRRLVGFQSARAV